MLTGLTGFLPESTLTLYDNLEFLFRILLSAALGAAIGLERTKRQKEAGVRTHCIIACASAVFMILSKYAFIDTAALAGSRGADTARIAEMCIRDRAWTPSTTPSSPPASCIRRLPTWTA